MSDSLNIKVINHLTGEISEEEVSGADKAANLLQSYVASQKALGVAIDQLKGYIGEWMGDADQEDVGNFRVRREQRETRTWTPEGLRGVGFDNDAIEVALKVNMAVAKQLVDEAIERGQIKPDAKKELNESADVSVTKPYLTFKVVR